jgi:hypothetical protein
MASQDLQSDVFKFVALRPPMPPSRDAASNNFTADDRTTPSETPVGRFIAQFNTENAATIPDKLKTFIAAQEYDLADPQSAGDTTLDAALKAANSVPSAKVSTSALASAIETATGKKMQDLYASNAATQMRQRLWDCFYAFYLLSGFVGQDLTSLTTNLRTFHLLNLLYRKQPVPDASTLSAILGATPIIDKIFTSIPKPAAPAAPTQDKMLSPQKAAAYAALWNNLTATHQALADVRALPFKATTHTNTEKLLASAAPRAAASPAKRNAPGRDPDQRRPGRAASTFRIDQIRTRETADRARGDGEV